MQLSLFSYPLNLILALIWAGGIYSLWRYRKKSRIVSFMLSKAATVSAILLFAGFCLATGLTGRREIMSSWPAAAVMLYFMSVLLFVLLRGWRICHASGKGRIRWRFFLNHAGLLLAVSSAFWGAPDSSTLMMRVEQGQPSSDAVSQDGRYSRLAYEVELTDFRTEAYEDGTPSMFEADIHVGGKAVTLKVNHPYAVSLGEDIYLSGYDRNWKDDSYVCILQIVKEPWKYAALAGIVMMLAGALLMFVRGPVRKVE